MSAGNARPLPTSPAPLADDLPQASPAAGGPQTVLVVDDSRAQRRLLCSYLKRWGFDVVEAASGEEALAICRRDDPSLIVSDWMMPGMGGLELCRAYRALRKDRYGYFILLTSKSDKGEVAEGLDVGADDFLTKPVAAAELRARIRAGQRVLDMERELTAKNSLLSKTLADLQVLHEAIDRDLIEARKLQQSLVRDRMRHYPGATVSLMLQPSGHVGGDLVGAFQANAREIGVYSIDVSGHGIASALMTARIAAYFSGNSPQQNIAIARTAGGALAMRPPAEVADSLNRIIFDEIETEHYLTMLLARIDLASGRVTMTQAGHPHPLLHRRDGKTEVLGSGGFPVGLVPGAQFHEFEAQLGPGDRLFLGSDGMTESTGPGGTMLGEEGLARLLQRNRDLTGDRFFEAMMWDLSNFAENRAFSDDVSAALVEFRGEG